MPTSVIENIVKPILLYGSEIWGFSKNIDCLEKIQLRFCKLLLNLKSPRSNYMIYGELGRFPIEIDIQNKDCVIQGKETKLWYLSYELLYMPSIDENVDSAWVKYFSYISFEEIENKHRGGIGPQ